jgi:HSP20 family protein
MTLRRWRPGRDILSIREGMNLIINDLLGGMASQEDTQVSDAWMPLVDTYETGNAVVLMVELPGFSKDEFSLEVRQNTLILQGKRRQEPELTGGRYHLRECAYGAFERSFLLPAMVDQDRVQATYRDGVLMVQLPKTEVAKPKRIAIIG